MNIFVSVARNLERRKLEDFVEKHQIKKTGIVFDPSIPPLRLVKKYMVKTLVSRKRRLTDSL